MKLDINFIIDNSVKILTAIIIVILVVSLILALIRFDAPNFKKIVKETPDLEFPSNAHAQRRRSLLRTMVYSDKLVYFVGYFLGILGIGVLGYTINNSSQTFTDKINMFGTGLTIYAVGFAIVSIIGQKIPYEPPSQSSILVAQNSHGLDSIKLDNIIMKTIDMQNKIYQNNKILSRMLAAVVFMIFLMLFLCLYLVLKYFLILT